MFKPSFPYTGNQVIISSGRVTHHSYDDFIFLFGKKGVAISSPATFTVDANERTIIASPKVELGYQAESQGEPVLLGNSTVTQLGFLLDAIQELSDALNLAKNNPEASLKAVIKASTILSETVKNIKAQLNTTCLSKTTYTR